MANKTHSVNGKVIAEYQVNGVNYVVVSTSEAITNEAPHEPIIIILD